jgi:hypothetical protein
MPDPLEPLRKMIEKWRHERQRLTGRRCCHGMCADELAAALPAFEEAMARIEAAVKLVNATQGHVKSQNCGCAECHALRLFADELLRALGRKVEP